MEHRELAEIAHRSLQHSLTTGDAQAGILQFTTPREDFTLFPAPPEYQDTPSVCREPFTLACILQGLPIPPDDSACARLLIKLDARSEGLDIHPTSTRLREAAAAAIWIGNLCANAPLGAESVDFIPSPQCLSTLGKLFPVSVANPCWKGTLKIASRRWFKLRTDLSVEATRGTRSHHSSPSPCPELSHSAASKRHSTASLDTGDKRSRSSANTTPAPPPNRPSVKETLTTEQLTTELAVARASGVENLTTILNLQSQLRSERDLRSTYQQTVDGTAAQAMSRQQEAVFRLQTECARLTGEERAQRTLKELHIKQVHDLTAQLAASQAACLLAQTALQTALQDSQREHEDASRLQHEAAADRAAAAAAQAEVARLENALRNRAAHPGDGRVSPQSSTSFPSGSPRSLGSFSRSASPLQNGSPNERWSPSPPAPG